MFTKTKYKDGEAREHFITEIHTMRFIIEHSRHVITRYGAAPNETVRNDDSALQDQLKREHRTTKFETVRVLRFDDQGKVTND